jgi:hypothetical protein
MGKFTYFKFNLQEKKSIIISLTNFNYYHQIFVDTIPKPLTSRFKWAAHDISFGVVTILKNDNHFIHGPNAFYYIGVYSPYNGNDGRSSEFQIGVKTEDSTDILSEGIQTFSKAISNEYQFYEYQLSNENDLWIETESTLFGESPALCISTEHKKPTREANQCMWKVEKSITGLGSITINNTETNWKKSSFYIGAK